MTFNEVDGEVGDLILSTVSGVVGVLAEGSAGKTVLCFRLLPVSSLWSLIRMDCLLGSPGLSWDFCREGLPEALVSLPCFRSDSDSDVVERSESVE